MPWFPVIATETVRVEQLLGIALPTRYTAFMLDPRLQQLFAHPSIGTLDPARSMMDFVRLTAEVRRDMPEFPATGVVATVPLGRYFKFWLPDPRNPARLGDVIYSWDTSSHRKLKDCTTDAWVRLSVQLAHDIDPVFFARVGYPLQRARDPEAAVQFRDGDPLLTALLAARGEEAAALAASVMDAWLPCARFQVSGKYLVPCDLGCLPDGARDRAVKVTPGEYEAQVQVTMSSRGDRPVLLALRVLPPGIGDVVATRVGVLDVDHAAVAVYDRQAFFQQVPPAARETVLDALAGPVHAPRVATVGRSGEVLTAPAGDGDGSYPVFELRRAGALVGFSIRFERGG